MKRGVTALALACVLTMSHGALAQTSINILTGAQNGVSYALGVALSHIYMKAIPDVRSTAQVTRAAAESLNLLQAGRAELAFTPGDALSAAWRGDEEAGFKTPLNKLRGLSATYNNYIQIVARADSGIRTVADLKGKRLSVGPARSPMELQRARDSQGRGIELPGPRESRVRTIRPVGRDDEGTAARCDARVSGRGRPARSATSP